MGVGIILHLSQNIDFVNTSYEPHVIIFSWWWYYNLHEFYHFSSIPIDEYKYLGFLHFSGHYGHYDSMWPCDRKVMA